MDKKEFNFRDFILNEPEIEENKEIKEEEKKEIVVRKKPEVEYEVQWADGCDFIIERKTKKTSQFMVFMLSKGQLYIKDKEGKIENLNIDNYVKFMEKLEDSGIEVNVNWIDTIEKGKRENEWFIELVTDEYFQKLARMGYVKVDRRNISRWTSITLKRNNNKKFDILMTHISVIKKLFELCEEYNVDINLLKEAVFNWVFLNRDDFKNLFGEKMSVLFDSNWVSANRRERQMSGLEMLSEKFGMSGVLQIAENIVRQDGFENETVYARRGRYYGSSDIGALYEMLKDNEFKFEKWLEYYVFESDRQGYDIGDFLREWHDTLEMQKQIYGEVKDKYPEHLASLHQKLAKRVAILKSCEEKARMKVKDKEAEKRAEKLNKNCIEVGKYIMTCPKSVKDILNEAEMQHNCLASYVDRYVNGNSDIYFLRKKDKEDLSLITIEVRNDKVVQACGKYNRRPDTNSQKAIKDWAEKTGITCTLFA